MSDPVRNIYFDYRMESYEGYVPDEWGAKAFEMAKAAPVLNNKLVDLALAWRTTAYTASMPTMAIKAMLASTLSYAKYVSPDSSIVGFGKDISVPCWTHHEINNAKLVRHALSHAGGRETADLKKQKHGIKLLEGVLQIVPADNHNLLRRLRAGVDELVAVAVVHPKFA